MSTQLKNIDHELMGLRAKLRWTHIAPITRQHIEERIAALEAKRRELVGQSA